MFKKSSKKCVDVGMGYVCVGVCVGRVVGCEGGSVGVY